MYWIASLTTTNTLSRVLVSMSAFNCSTCKLIRPATFSTKGDFRWSPGPATRTNLPNRSTTARSCCSTVKKKSGIRRPFRYTRGVEMAQAHDANGAGSRHSERTLTDRWSRSRARHRVRVRWVHMGDLPKHGAPALASVVLSGCGSSVAGDETVREVAV